MWQSVRIPLVLLVASAAVWLAASWPHALDITYRQTVSFSTPTGIHVASGVARKKLYGTWDGSFDPFVAENNYGEALGVELPGYGYAFVIFTYPDLPPYRPGNLFSEACNAPYRVDEEPNGWLRRIDIAFVGKCNVPTHQQPQVVIFKNPADFKTATIYDALHLPKGLSISSYEIERTQDPVTFGTTDVLTFLQDGSIVSYGGELPGPAREGRSGPVTTRAMFVRDTPL